MTGAGLPPFVAEQIAAVFDELRAGAQDSTTDDGREDHRTGGPVAFGRVRRRGVARVFGG